MMVVNAISYCPANEVGENLSQYHGYSNYSCRGAPQLL